MRPTDGTRRLLAELPYALAPFALYVATTWSHWGEAPVLDGMVNFRESLTLHASGLRGLLAERGGSAHPPLLFGLLALVYSVLGRSPGAYNAFGALSSAAASLAVYSLARRHMTPKVAMLSAAFVLSNPLLVACELYPMSEALIVLGAAVGLFALEADRKRWLLVSGAMLVLSKSTALMLLVALVVAVLLRDGCRRLLTRTSLLRLARRLSPLLPAAVLLAGWNLYLSSIGGRGWDSYVFGDDTGSPFAVVAKRLVTLKLFDVHLKQNLQHALFVNFQWLFVAVLIASAAVWWRRSSVERRVPFFVQPALLGAFLYAAVALSFPTWTAPRYALPVVVLLNLCTPFLLSERLRPALALGVVLNLVATFTSVDPLTRVVFGTRKAHGETLYDLDYAWRGPDREMYNLQLSAMARAQDATIRSACASSAEVIVDDCFDLKIGERLWSIGVHPEAYPAYPKSCPRTCFPVEALNDLGRTPELTGRRVYVSNPHNKEIVATICPTCRVVTGG